METDFVSSHIVVFSGVGRSGCQNMALLVYLKVRHQHEAFAFLVLCYVVLGRVKQYMGLEGSACSQESWMSFSVMLLDPCF